MVGVIHELPLQSGLNLKKYDNSNRIAIALFLHSYQLFVYYPLPITDLSELRRLTQIKIREIRKILLNP